MNSTTHSEREKSKSKSWFEDKIKSIAANSVPKEKQERYKANFNLFNGRGKLEDFNDQSSFMQYKEEGESGINLIRHFDILSTILSAQVGDEEKRPFKPICIDVSVNSSDEYKRKRRELIIENIKQQVEDPIIKQVQQEMEGASPEEMQKEVEKRSPEDIQKYLSKKFKSSASIQGQKIIDFYIRKLGLRFLFNQAFKNFLVTGLPILYAGSYNDEVEVELVNPSGFTWGGDGNHFFIEDADWWRYERQMTVNEVYRRYSGKLTKKDMDALDNLLSSSYDNITERKESTIVHEFSLNPERVENIDLLNSEGQDAYKREYVRALSKYGDTSISHIHCVWKSLSLFKFVTRIGEDGESTFFADSSYEFNELAGDTEIVEEWIPQLFEGTLISLGGHDIILNAGIVEEQYSSLDDPRNIKGPYHGLAWGNFFGNSEYLSPLDKGKPHQYDYNVVRSKLTRIIAENRGKVLVTTFNAKPKDWEWDKWMGYLDDGILMVDTSEASPSDAQVLKSVDLSSSRDISDTIGYLEAIKQEAAQAMSYNPSRLGQASPYMTATNNQQNVVQSMSQTEDIYYTFNLLKENFLTYVLKVAKRVHKKNKKPLVYILDDNSLSELEIDQDILDYANWGIYISNSSEDQENLIIAKSFIQPLAQNGAMGFPDVIKAQWSTSHVEVLNAAQEAEDKMEQRMQQAQQAKAEEMKAQQDGLIQKMQMEQQFQERMFQLKAELEITLAQIDVNKYSNQYDIDRDMKNDNLELEREKFDFEEKENEKDRENKIEIEKLKLKKMNNGRV